MDAGLGYLFTFQSKRKVKCSYAVTPKMWTKQRMSAAKPKPLIVDVQGFENKPYYY